MCCYKPDISGYIFVSQTCNLRHWAQLESSHISHTNCRKPALAPLFLILASLIPESCPQSRLLSLPPHLLTPRPALCSRSCQPQFPSLSTESYARFRWPIPGKTTQQLITSLHKHSHITTQPHSHRSASCHNATRPWHCPYGEVFLQSPLRRHLTPAHTQRSRTSPLNPALVLFTPSQPSPHPATLSTRYTI